MAEAPAVGEPPRTGAATPSTRAEGRSSGLGRRCDALLEGAVRGGHPPGVAAVLLDRRGPLWVGAAGLADVVSGRPVRPDTVFRWYSLTKPVTASLVLRLVHGGQLSLASTLGEALPDAAARLPAPLGAVTVRQLLSHGGGFRDRMGDAAAWFQDSGNAWPAPREFLLARLAEARTSTPGRAHHYSNLGYAVLGEIASEVCGAPFREAVEREVLAPLGMGDTGFRLPSSPEARAEGTVSPWSVLGLAVRLPKGRSFLDRRHRRWLLTRHRDPVFAPHGGLVGPVGDLVPFLRAHLVAEGDLAQAPGGRSSGAAASAGVRGEPLPRLLPASLVALMRDQAWRCGRLGREAAGLGWCLVRRGGHLHVSHGGRGPGFTTHMRLVPELGLGVAVLGNGSFDSARLARRLLGCVQVSSSVAAVDRLDTGDGLSG